MSLAALPVAALLALSTPAPASQDAEGAWARDAQVKGGVVHVELRGRVTQSGISLPPVEGLPRACARCDESAVRVGVVGADAAAAKTAAHRLRELGFSARAIDAELLSAPQQAELDVIYVASGWAAAHTSLEKWAGQLHRWLLKGGALIVEQANPYKFPEDRYASELVPWVVGFDNWYTSDDRRRSILDDDHPITRDLPAEAMPIPADRIYLYDTRYRVLARGEGSGTPALLVGEPGEGRVVVHTSVASIPGALPSETLRRMVLWSAKTL
jgi:hypothetical protein